MTTHILLEGAVDLNAAASYSSGTAPSGWSVGDNLHILDGSQTVNVNLTALSGKSLAVVLIGPNFRGAIGDAGSSMQIGTISTALRVSGGGGDFFINPGTCALAEVRDTRGGLCSLSGGTMTDLVTYAGRVRVPAAAVVTNFHNIGAVAALAYNATGLTLLNHKRGKSSIDRAIATGKLLLGQVIAEKNSSVSSALDLFGGLWDHRGGNVAGLTGWDGVFTCENSRVDFSITGTLTRYKGFKLFDKKGSATVTLPGTIKDYGYGEEAATASFGGGTSV